MSEIAEIPYGGYWSTPFSKWQGSFSHLHSVRFAAHVAVRELEKRGLSPEIFDYGVMGLTVPQQHSFYGLPWLTGMIGARSVGGPTISQACATSASCISNAAREVQAKAAGTALVVTCDRISNGPHLYYPNPLGMGGAGDHENWVMDNISCDPLAGNSMTETAENVAKKWGVSTAEQHEVVLRRQEQYRQALEDGSAFLKRFITLPFEVPNARFNKTMATLEGDEGLRESTPQGLAALKPVTEGGTVTYGGQTHPADGNAAMIVASPEKARELSADKSIVIKLLGFGMARVEQAYMPEAPMPAAKNALKAAGLSIGQMEAIKTHNPFAVNDVVFAKSMDVDVMTMNNYGCSLIWGHPQGPTGLRLVIELIEELVLRGGGYGLFTGCAAGDTAMAVVLQVGDA